MDVKNTLVRSTRASLVGLTLGLTSLAASGCATKGDLRNVENELQGIDVRIEALLGLVERQSELTERTQTQTGQEIGNFQGEVTRLLREIRDELDQLGAASEANGMVITQLRDRVDRLEGRIGRRGVAAVGPGMEEDPARDSGDLIVPGQESAESMYRTAQDAYNVGSYTTARFGFEALLEAHPVHDLAALALLRLGEIATEEGEYREAVAHFDELRQRFPESGVAPRAMYLMGLVYWDELDDEEEGRRVLRRLVNTYEDSEMAAMARERLGGFPT